MANPYYYWWSWTLQVPYSIILSVIFSHFQQITGLAYSILDQTSLFPLKLIIKLTAVLSANHAASKPILKSINWTACTFEIWMEVPSNKGIIALRSQKSIHVRRVLEMSLWNAHSNAWNSNLTSAPRQPVCLEWITCKSHSLIKFKWTYFKIIHVLVLRQPTSKWSHAPHWIVNIA